MQEAISLAGNWHKRSLRQLFLTPIVCFVGGCEFEKSLCCLFIFALLKSSGKFIEGTQGASSPKELKQHDREAQTARNGMWGGVYVVDISKKCKQRVGRVGCGTNISKELKRCVKRGTLGGMDIFEELKWCVGRGTCGWISPRSSSNMKEWCMRQISLGSSSANNMWQIRITMNYIFSQNFPKVKKS